MFSPFPNSKTREFTRDDLESLVEHGVVEGQFVEYKSELVKSHKIANSLASFANSYGGWYIVGIEADSQVNCARSVCGIDLSSVRDPSATIREAAKEYLSPTPVFFTEAVELASGKVVVVVCIPERQDKPVVSRDGRIYRRLADASDPIFEKDRQVIDRLVAEGKEHTRRFGAFCSDDRTHSKGEANSPWIHIYVRPYPDWIEKWPPVSLEELERLLATASKPVNVPLGEVASLMMSPRFDAASTGPGCAIVTAFGNGQPHRHGLTLEFHNHGWARLRVPLPWKFMDDGNGWEHATSPDVVSVLRKYGHENHSLRLLDAYHAFTSILMSVFIYQRWLGELPPSTGFDYKIVIEGAWRMLPFFDAPEWADYAKKCGVPLVPSDTIQVPRFDQLTFLPEDSSDFHFQVAINAMLGLGMPLEVALNGFWAPLAREAERRSAKEGT